MSFRIDKTIALLFAIITLLVIGTLFWSSGVGFEYSDESFYFLGFKYFSNSPNLHGAPFHRVLHRTLDWIEPNIQRLRLIRLVLFVAVSVILFFTLKRFSPRNMNLADGIILLCLITMGMFLGYSRGPQALSYNSLSAIIIVVITALWIQNLNSLTGISGHLRNVLIGGMFILLLFVKITNLILFPILIVGSIIWFTTYAKDRPNMKSIAFMVLALILGSSLTLVFIKDDTQTAYSLVFDTISNTFSKTSNNSGHSISALYLKYQENVIMVWDRISVAFLSIMGLFTLLKAVAYFTKKDLKAKSANIFLFLSLASYFWLAYIDQHWLGGTSRKYLILDPYILIWLIVYLHQFFRDRRSNQLLLLGLLCLPICGAIGTNNGLSSQFLHYAVFIFLGIWIMLNSAKSYIRYIVLSLILILSSIQIITGVINDPYRQSDLRNSIYSLEGISDLDGIQVDFETNKLFNALNLHRDTPEEYVFTFSHQSGIITLLNKKPLSLQWANSGNSITLCKAISKNEIQADNLMFAIPKEFPLSEEDIRCFLQEGIDMNDFELVDVIQYHDYVRNKQLELEIFRKKQLSRNEN